MTRGKRRRNLIVLSMIWYEPITILKTITSVSQNFWGFQGTGSIELNVLVMCGLMPMLYAQDLPINSK
jgi:hypothetical protein